MDSGKGSTERKSKDKIFIAAYNRRTMRKEEDEELEHELENIKWDIIGLSETGLPLSDNNHYLGGVGFLINKNTKQRVTRFCAISDRVIYTTLKLNKRYDIICR